MVSATRQRYDNSSLAALALAIAGLLLLSWGIVLAVSTNRVSYPTTNGSSNSKFGSTPDNQELNENVVVVDTPQIVRWGFTGTNDIHATGHDGP